ncbi:hypothetical protein [Lyngbya aestuarii]
MSLIILAKALRQAGIDLNTVCPREINAFGQNDLYSRALASTGKPTQ